MSLAPKSGHVVVRMYNVGFGDCFLLVFPDPAFRILIDCGSHISAPGPRPIEEVVSSVLADVDDGDGPRIDVVVCTHRHRDHVSGFTDPRWKEVEVGEVWMPWTEDPRDPEAKRIRERQAHLAMTLTAALDGHDDGNPAAVLAANSLPNAKAMRTLHEGFTGRPRRHFLPRGDGEEVVTELETELLRKAGVRVRVLGPAHDEKVIRDMDPPSGAAYLRVASARADGENGAAPPFGDAWTLTSEQVAGNEDLAHLLLAGRERSALREAARGDVLGAAVALEKAVNGTSLVLCLDRGDARLFFPADAQWGTWERILEDKEASDLVEHLSLLKVGHHGSHNATPKGFVELLAGRPTELGDPWALVPTRPIKIWPFIPKAELLEALAKVTPRVARSDMGAKAAAPGFASWSEATIDVHVPI
jgi:hypothetical protein